MTTNGQKSWIQLSLSSRDQTSSMDSNVSSFQLLMQLLTAQMQLHVLLLARGPWHLWASLQGSSWRLEVAWTCKWDLKQEEGELDALVFKSSQGNVLKLCLLHGGPNRNLKSNDTLHIMSLSCSSWACFMGAQTPELRLSRLRITLTPKPQAIKNLEQTATNKPMRHRVICTTARTLWHSSHRGWTMFRSIKICMYSWYMSHALKRNTNKNVLDAGVHSVRLCQKNARVPPLFPFQCSRRLSARFRSTHGCDEDQVGRVECRDRPCKRNLLRPQPEHRSREHLPALDVVALGQMRTESIEQHH